MSLPTVTTRYPVPWNRGKLIGPKRIAPEHAVPPWVDKTSRIDGQKRPLRPKPRRFVGWAGEGKRTKRAQRSAAKWSLKEVVRGPRRQISDLSRGVP